LRDRAAVGALLWPTGDADAQVYEEIVARAASAHEHWAGAEGLSFRGATTPNDAHGPIWGRKGICRLSLKPLDDLPARAFRNDA
jgi:hypothetical protein